MNTTAIQNRNQVYFSIIDSLSKKRKKIFGIIRQNPNCSAIEITYKYGIPINEVVGRITELKGFFLITESGSKTNQQTKKQNTTYKTIENSNQRIDLINQRYTELIEQKATLERDYILGVSTLTRDLIQKEINKINKQIYTLDRIANELK